MRLAQRHYENFPVASWLCPPGLRPAVAAIYGFARTADDLADEGDAGAAAGMNGYCSIAPRARNSSSQWMW